MHSYIFELIMLLCFGASWPFAIARTLRTKVVKGKSPFFLALVVIGYAAGMMHKIINPPAADASMLARYIIWFYGINLCMVAFDLYLYWRYRATAK